MLPGEIDQAICLRRISAVISCSECNVFIFKNMELLKMQEVAE